MTRLSTLLTAASAGALREGSDTSLASLIAEVRRERERMYRRACEYAKAYHMEFLGNLPRRGRKARLQRKRRWRALNRIVLILRGEPAFALSKTTQDGE